MTFGGDLQQCFVAVIFGSTSLRIIQRELNAMLCQHKSHSITDSYSCAGLPTCGHVSVCVHDIRKADRTHFCDTVTTPWFTGVYDIGSEAMSAGKLTIIASTPQCFISALHPSEVTKIVFDECGQDFRAWRPKIANADGVALLHKQDSHHQKKIASDSVLDIHGVVLPVRIAFQQADAQAFSRNYPVHRSDRKTAIFQKSFRKSGEGAPHRTNPARAKIENSITENQPNFTNFPSSRK